VEDEAEIFTTRIKTCQSMYNLWAKQQK